MIIGHGGNIHEIARRLNCDPAEIVDMSSNMNPTGPLPGLMAHLKARLNRITALPQADARDCVSAFAGRYRLDAASVLAANGTTQFIYTIPAALNVRRALIVGPTYADYADACRMYGVEHRFFLTHADADFRPDLDRLRQAIPEADTVFICNPNNPTGVLVDREALTALCASFPDKRFIIDESYMPFVASPQHFSMADAGLPHVVVLNSMSKIFRIPGLRIGFLVAAPRTADRFRRFLMPWAVNSLAQAAILYLMAQTDTVDRFIADTHRFLDRERRMLAAGLAQTAGIRLFASTTSFVLARVNPPHTADSVLARALSRRILLRNCANFVGLDDRYIRISLKNNAANAALVKALQALDADGPSELAAPEGMERAVLG